MTAPLLPTIARKDQRLSRLHVLTIFVTLFLVSASAKTLANDQEGAPALLIVPDFERPPVSLYLAGSKRTLATPALINKSGQITYLKSDALKTPEAWDSFVKEARDRSLLELATLDPTMVRDAHGVIQMAVITTDSPVTASCILLPGFLQHFSAIFGPEILIAIPTHNKICIFPKLANHLPQMAGAIRDDYLISPKPASTEIFELSRNGLHAVGSLNPDDE